MAKKQTLHELEEVNKALKTQLNYFQELFKERNARPLLLPNTVTPTEFNWLVEKLNGYKTILETPILKVPDPVKELIILPNG